MGADIPGGSDISSDEDDDEEVTIKGIIKHDKSDSEQETSEESDIEDISCENKDCKERNKQQTRMIRSSNKLIRNFEAKGEDDMASILMLTKKLNDKGYEQDHVQAIYAMEEQIIKITQKYKKYKELAKKSIKEKKDCVKLRMKVSREKSLRIKNLKQRLNEFRMNMPLSYFKNKQGEVMDPYVSRDPKDGAPGAFFFGGRPMGTEGLVIGDDDRHYFLVKLVLQKVSEIDQPKPQNWFFAFKTKTDDQNYDRLVADLGYCKRIYKNTKCRYCGKMFDHKQFSDKERNCSPLRAIIIECRDDGAAIPCYGPIHNWHARSGAFYTGRVCHIDGVDF